MEKLRLTDSDVECSHVVCSIALMVGRLAPRTGDGGESSGMTLWEATRAEGLSSISVRPPPPSAVEYAESPSPRPDEAEAAGRRFLQPVADDPAADDTL